MLRLLIRKFPSIVSVLWTPPLPGHAPPLEVKNVKIQENLKKIRGYPGIRYSYDVLSEILL